GWADQRGGVPRRVAPAWRLDALLRRGHYWPVLPDAPESVQYEHQRDGDDTPALPDGVGHHRQSPGDTAALDTATARRWQSGRARGRGVHDDRRGRHVRRRR